MKSCVYDNIEKIQPTNPCRLVGCTIFLALIRQPMLRRAVHIFLLNRHRSYVPHIDFMPNCGTSRTGIVHTSYGPHLLDHLAAHGAGLPGGQVAVVAVLQIHADLPWCLFYIVNFQISIVSSEESVRTGKVGTAAWSERLPMNL